MRKKNVGRALALQALYQYGLRGEAFLDDADAFFAESAKNPADAEIGKEIFDCVRAAQDQLDASIKKVAEHWNLDRMASIDRGILRIATYELTQTPEMPGQIVISEAIRLAKKYSTAESSAFVNGILDKIMAAESKKGESHDA
jgi:transcription antitermination protein NusB